MPITPKNNNQYCGLALLPDEINLKIVSYLDLGSLGSIAQTCCSFFRLAKDEQLLCSFEFDYSKPDYSQSHLIAEEAVKAMALSACNKILAVATHHRKNNIHLFDAYTGEKLSTLQDQSLAPYRDDLYTVQLFFTRDSRYLIVNYHWHPVYAYESSIATRRGKSYIDVWDLWMAKKVYRIDTIQNTGVTPLHISFFAPDKFWIIHVSYKKNDAIRYSLYGCDISNRVCSLLNYKTVDLDGFFLNQNFSSPTQFIRVESAGFKKHCLMICDGNIDNVIKVITIHDFNSNTGLSFLDNRRIVYTTLSRNIVTLDLITGSTNFVLTHEDKKDDYATMFKIGSLANNCVAILQATKVTIWNVAAKHHVFTIPVSHPQDICTSSDGRSLFILSEGEIKKIRYPRVKKEAENCMMSNAYTPAATSSNTIPKPP